MKGKTEVCELEGIKRGKENEKDFFFPFLITSL